MMADAYARRSDVYLTEPSGRLGLPGIFFPYTPTITVMNSSNYSSYTITHSNFQQMAFDLSNNAVIQLTCPIVVRDEEEVATIIAMADFLRGSLKMGFGRSRQPDVGRPPPMLQFNAYGVYQNVPVVVQDFTWNFDNDVDYIQSGQYKIPVVSTFAMTLQSSYGADKVRNDFTLRGYATGQLRNKGYV